MIFVRLMSRFLSTSSLALPHPERKVPLEWVLSERRHHARDGRLDAATSPARLEAWPAAPVPPGGLPRRACLEGRRYGGGGGGTATVSQPPTLEPAPPIVHPRRCVQQGRHPESPTSPPAAFPDERFVASYRDNEVAHLKQLLVRSEMANSRLASEAANASKHLQVSE